VGQQSRERTWIALEGLQLLPCAAVVDRHQHNADVIHRDVHDRFDRRVGNDPRVGLFTVREVPAAEIGPFGAGTHGCTVRRSSEGVSSRRSTSTEKNPSALQPSSSSDPGGDAGPVSAMEQQFGWTGQTKSSTRVHPASRSTVGSDGSGSPFSVPDADGSVCSSVGSSGVVSWGSGGSVASIACSSCPGRVGVDELEPLVERGLVREGVAGGVDVVEGEQGLIELGQQGGGPARGGGVGDHRTKVGEDHVGGAVGVDGDVVEHPGGRVGEPAAVAVGALGRGGAGEQRLERTGHRVVGVDRASDGEGLAAGVAELIVGEEDLDLDGLGRRFGFGFGRGLLGRPAAASGGEHDQQHQQLNERAPPDPGGGV
jgi:hypothetical protein